MAVIDTGMQPCESCGSQERYGKPYDDDTWKAAAPGDRAYNVWGIARLCGKCMAAGRDFPDRNVATPGPVH